MSYPDWLECGHLGDLLHVYARCRPKLDPTVRDLCQKLAHESVGEAEILRSDKSGYDHFVAAELHQMARSRNPRVRELCTALLSLEDSWRHVVHDARGGEEVPDGSITSEPPVWPAEKTLTILFAAADPSDRTRLRVGDEAREIRAAIRRSIHRDHIVFEQWTSVRAADLHNAVLDLRPQIVHFAGHGAAEGLCFEDYAGNATLVPAEALATFFSVFANEVRCVVLNACYSEPQARAIARHIPFVVGMSQEIEDRTAIAFATGFYQAVAAGRSLTDAHTLGCTLAAMERLPGHLVPVLIERPA